MSATHACASAKASFSASICTCTLSAESTDHDDISKCSRIPRAIKATMPWPLGGIWWMVYPR
ncbi:Uncharacterised protein [Mycobacterium tuberculosis]|nr:Uncharacterised protein [Mycobacterium tuberculosis]